MKRIANETLSLLDEDVVVNGTEAHPKRQSPLNGRGDKFFSNSYSVNNVFPFGQFRCNAC